MPLHVPASTDSSPVLLVNTSEPPTSKPVQNFRYVYTHRQKVYPSELAPTAPSPVDGPPLQPSTSPSDLDIIIALRKGKRSCINHPISMFISYDHLNHNFYRFALSVSSESILGSCEEVLLVPA